MIQRVPDHPDLFDDYAARAGRDAGMARVLDHEPEFRDQFAQAIERLPRGWVGTCEDIRRDWTGITPHPNAWGACWNAAKKRGLLVELPQQVHMVASKSHARKTHLHRRV
ncbi:hypothetical protein [Bradyrhizobium japonicum]|uniref:hypothetical protein n=1 Tax=Bradyrhizobium japonicum TaxID=375 RepID=UPI00200F303B|nr:hypothetical protein [Bradyrhizobium japonicum]UQD96074.1 hypothetical protein JEY30_31525 [Bradyrhizobium japonicum]